MLLRTIHSHSIQRQDGWAYLVRPLASLDPDRSWRNILDKNLAAWRNVSETRTRIMYPVEACRLKAMKPGQGQPTLQGFKSLAAANQNNDGSASGRCSDNVAPPSQSLTFISQYPDQPGRNPKRSSAPRLPMKIMRIANIRNGLVYPHDEVCNFQSNHGHHKKCGYFRIDAMPYSAVIHLLKGGDISIIDGTAHNKQLSDALKFGVPTWCLVYNRAIKWRDVRVCNWQTKDMKESANSTEHRKLVQTIRKLAEIYNPTQPAIIGNNIHLECHSQIQHDDNNEAIKDIINRRAAVSVSVYPSRVSIRAAATTKFREVI